MHFFTIKCNLMKMCNFINLFIKLDIYVLPSRFKKFRYSKNDISSFFKFFSKIVIFYLLVYRGIVVKWIIPICLKRF
jgi:hypothetical protein